MTKKATKFVLVSFIITSIWFILSAFSGLKINFDEDDNFAIKSTQLPNFPINVNIMLPDSIINFAKEQIGVRYRWGGTTTKGFDCSGFVYYVYRNFGIDIPRSSKGMTDVGKSIALEDCQKGDIILFTRPKSKTRTVGHVGIIISEKGEPIKFIHSSSAKNRRGVVITDFEGGYITRFVGIRRILTKEIAAKEKLTKLIGAMPLSNHSAF
ncbi:MAG: C40 family peptidase [Ignavibacteriales bacterium]|nr:C40 family peptidase [Ignavibacteriales bacterium]